MLAWVLCLLQDTIALDNGTLKIEVDLKAGGAITYLSYSDSKRNLINTFDRGREVQQSYYAGQPLDRRAEGQSKDWSPWPWNPVQCGDAYKNVSKVLAHGDDGKTLYVKVKPLLWDMKNESAECELENWITLSGAMVRVHNRLTCSRTDKRWEARPCSQELPAVYAIADLHQIFTYVGDKPFTKDALKKIEHIGIPWANWKSTEHWAASVDEKEFGIAVFNPRCTDFTGGLYLKAGGGSKDDPTCYLSPLLTETLDKNSVFEYEYFLLVGSLKEMRERIYKLNEQPLTPTRVKATAKSSSEIHLTWTDLSDREEEFRIERSPDGKEFKLVGTAVKDSTSFTDTGLAAGTPYTYRVQSFGKGGSSAPSLTVTARTAD